MRYLGWLIVGIVVGAAVMWAVDHQDLLANRKKLSGAEQIFTGLKDML